jgi:hypothetical protein
MVPRRLGSAGPNERLNFFTPIKAIVAQDRQVWQARSNPRLIIIVGEDGSLEMAAALPFCLLPSSVRRREEERGRPALITTVLPLAPAFCADIISCIWPLSDPYRPHKVSGACTRQSTTAVCTNDARQFKLKRQSKDWWTIFSIDISVTNGIKIKPHSSYAEQCQIYRFI